MNPHKDDLNAIVCIFLNYANTHFSPEFKFLTNIPELAHGKTWREEVTDDF